MNRRSLLLAGAALPFLLGLAGEAAAQPERIGLDYAYYNPVSLLLRQKGWLEEEFAADGITVEWVLSQGSNRSLEYLASSSIDFGSTAGGAALVGRANGNPIQGIYVYSRPEWTALVTRADTGITRVEDLAGKRVAVTRGTDPHLFLLRSLAAVGLSEDDIEAVLLQHPDGAAALVAGDVDAWAGLDPHMARVEIEDGAVLFHRDPSLNTYGVLNVREEFAAENPEIVERVLQVYERARLYSIEHPDELRDILVAEASLTPEIAEKQLNERTDLSNSIIGDEHRAALTEAGIVLQQIGVIAEDVDVPTLVADYVNDQFVAQLTQ